jgi:hypothetical protein
MAQHPGWKVHQEILAHMGNMLAEDVLGRKFRSLEDHQKLVRMEAYSMVSEVLKFLLTLPANVNKAIKLKEKAGVTSIGGATAVQPRGATQRRGATKGGLK